MTAQIFKDLGVLINTNPEIVSGIVDLSRKHGILYHGARKFYEKILEQGVRPLTPEGGYGSFWAKGLSLFVPHDHGRFRLSDLRDTPFFNYAYHDDGTGISLVVTDEDTLAKYGIQNRDSPGERTDCVVIIKETVPPEAFDMIRVVGSRETYKETQKILVETLYSRLRNYPPKRGARIITG